MLEGNSPVSSEIKTWLFWCHITAFAALGYWDCYSHCKGNPVGLIDRPTKYLGEAFLFMALVFFGAQTWGKWTNLSLEYHQP